MVHCGSVRQTAAIIAMEKDHLRSGDKSKIMLRFNRFPEYLHVGARLIFREGRTKAVGTVARVFYPGDIVPAFPVTIDSVAAAADDS
jgi:GTPase